MKIVKIRVFYTHETRVEYENIYIHIQAVCKSKNDDENQLKSELSSSKAMTMKSVWRKSVFSYFHRQVDSLLTKRVGRTQTIHTKCSEMLKWSGVESVESECTTKKKYIIQPATTNNVKCEKKRQTSEWNKLAKTLRPF